MGLWQDVPPAEQARLETAVLSSVRSLVESLPPGRFRALKIVPFAQFAQYSRLLALTGPYGLRHLYSYGGRGRGMSPVELANTAPTPIPGIPPHPPLLSRETLTVARARKHPAKEGGCRLV